MGSARRKAVVIASVMAYAVLLVLGPRLLGGWTGGVILVASFASASPGSCSRRAVGGEGRRGVRRCGVSDRSLTA